MNTITTLCLSGFLEHEHYAKIEQFIMFICSKNMYINIYEYCNSHLLGINNYVWKAKQGFANIGNIFLLKNNNYYFKNISVQKLSEYVSL